MPDGQLTTDTVKKLINSRKKKNLVKDIFLKLKHSGNDLQDFNEFLGELMKVDSSYIINEIYYEIREKASKILSFNNILKMDEIILGNYIHSEREQFITSFKGSLEIIGARIEGYLVLTNLRIAGVGIVKRNLSDEIYYWNAAVLGGLLGATVAKKVIKERVKRGDSVQWAFNRDMRNIFSDEELHKFNYNFPIIRVYDIKTTFESLSYYIKLKYEHEFGLKAVRIRITPQREKVETKRMFATRRNEVLERIEEVLLRTQLLDDYKFEKPPNTLFLMRTSKEINNKGEEIINKICAHCGDMNNFTKPEVNIFKCLRCGAKHHMRDY